MSIERSVCDLVQRRWSDLHPNAPVPDSLVFLKVAGKTSPNAAIIALVLDAHRRSPVAVAKIPRNRNSALGLEREYAAMLDLRQSVSNPEVLSRVPCRGILAEHNGVQILLQEAGRGHPMVREMTSRKSVEALYEQILPWMLDFHAEGSEECTLEGKTLLDLVETPIATFMNRFGDASCEIFSTEARQYLSELPHKVAGRTLRLCRQHGDFNAHNVLVECKHGGYQDFKLIDWEDYRPRQLPIHDLNHFFISNSNLLGAGLSPVESYVRLVLGAGWYRDLYLKALADSEARGLIDQETFWALSPLYFVGVVLTTLDIQRLQKETAKTWLQRMTHLIRSMSERARH